MAVWEITILLQKKNIFHMVDFCHVFDFQEGSATPLNLLSMISETNPCLGLKGDMII